MNRLLTSRDERDCALDELEEVEAYLVQLEEELFQELSLNWFLTEDRKEKIARIRQDMASTQIEIDLLYESLYGMEVNDL